MRCIETPKGEESRYFVKKDKLQHEMYWNFGIMGVKARL